jgi:hypothetical protein
MLQRIECASTSVLLLINLVVQQIEMDMYPVVLYHFVFPRNATCLFVGVVALWDGGPAHVPTCC